MVLILLRRGSNGKRPERGGTSHNADSARTVAMTILPTQELAAGSVPADAQGMKESPERAGAFKELRP
jgi:hypothetical protein